MKTTLYTLAIAGSLCLPAVAAEQATAVRQTDLKAKPFTDAETVASLAERTRVEVLKRETSWIEVKSAPNTGWVKMLSLRFDPPANAAAASASNPFLMSIGKGGSGSVATTGVRGLKEEQLINPQPNPAALQQMQGNAVSSEDAAKFAASGGLQSQAVKYVAAGGAK
ncbi:hypothetical protein GCM10027277_51740 [Pseudoduganella ginsengisoli]|uniref:SH3 domain-containing protein n=1 Tax=Pseudoduganella ginsengisoli TaxID=1462440 RepID=A0A6L6Q464_9BURK|nr:SH3 domain-containing protein [Pseudoduganella ginsengisoli]MTW04395.1 SH3 domain-containing protein [Pseudoduganella ginsengisoli]